jgi:hypothetical protein
MMPQLHWSFSIAQHSNLAAGQTFSNATEHCFGIYNVVLHRNIINTLHQRRAIHAINLQAAALRA